MPSNVVEDRIHNQFELESSLCGQHSLQAVDGTWSYFNHNEQARKQESVGAPLSFNLDSYSLQQLGSLQAIGVESLSKPVKKNSKLLTPIPENSRVPYRKQNLVGSGYSLGCQGFGAQQNQLGTPGRNASYNLHFLNSSGFSVYETYQENEICESPTLTTNSERSEVTEASTDFNFLEGQEQLYSRQQAGLSQPLPMQQSGYNDLQLLQQDMMLKQLQDLQRQQQPLQQFGDVRQQNTLNQLSAIPRQNAVNQMSPFINGMPVHDTSQMFMNLVPRGASPTTPGVPNRVGFSQEQAHSLHPMGLAAQQPNASLYGTPVANARSNSGQYSHFQGMSNDALNMFSKAGGQTQKPTMQSPGAFLRDQYVISPDQYMQQAASMSNQGFQGKDIFGPASVQGFNNGTMSGNFLFRNAAQMDSAAKDSSGRQEQAGWPAMQQKTKQLDSQGLVPLDPIEEKILYNMDDSFWGSSFGSRPELGDGSFNNTLDNNTCNAFPSMLSGSWSALMQSAVAEASSGDTGVQEEWSGLTFQNTEQSNDNQLLNLIDGEKQQTGWVDNNFQSTSFSPKSTPAFKDSGASSSFPGFQQTNNQLSTEQGDKLFQEGLSVPKSPKVSSEWTDCSPWQKHHIEGNQQIKSNTHVDNAWVSQIHKHPGNDANNLVNGDNKHPTGQQAIGNNRSDYLENASISRTKENESMGKTQHQISKGACGFSNLFGVDGDIFEKQQRNYLRETPSDSFHSQGLNIRDHGHSERVKLYGDASTSVNFSQGRIPGEDIHSSGDGSNIAPQTSQHMLDLLQKVDHSSEGDGAAHTGSLNYNSMSKDPPAESHTSSGQLYNQPFSSQGFGLKLAPPSQRAPNSKNFLSSQGSLQTRQINSELQEKYQTWGNNVTALESSLSQLRNQSQTPNAPDSAMAFQPSAANISSTASKFPPFNFDTLQGRSQQTSASPFGQQFPVLEAGSVTRPHHLSGMSQQGELSAMRNTWSTSQQQLSGVESIRVPSNFPSSMNPSESGTNLVACGYGEMQPVNESSLPETSSKIITSSELDGFSQGKEISQHQSSDVNASPSIFSASHSIHKSLDGARHNDNHASSVSNKKFAPADQFLKQTNNVKQNNSLLHQVQGTEGAETDTSKGTHNLLCQVQGTESAEADTTKGTQNAQHASPTVSGQLYDHDPRLQNFTDNGPSSSVGETKLMSVFSGGREDPSAKAVSQHAAHDTTPSEMFRFGQNVSQGQSTLNNFVTAHTNRAQVNLQMAPSWFKQYGSFKNGEMLPMSDARVAKPTAGHFSAGKPSQDLPTNASLQQVEVDSNQVASTRPNAARMSVATERLSTSCALPKDVSNQTLGIARPKKRKALTFELRSWHKEVTNGSQMHPLISISEQEWALAVNKLCEKVEGDAEILEDVPPMIRSKRRLILTTQLMQLVFLPAPSAILSADATSHYDSMSYITSRLGLGDSCSLSLGVRNGMQLPSDNSNMTSEENPKHSEKSSDKKHSEIMEEFISRAKKLENNFQRMDKTASVLDLRVECEEMERFSVINRFAKFHSRAPAENPGSASSGIQKLLPQRYVMALPLPRNLPDGVHCLSL